jgi:rubrerythrin
MNESDRIDELIAERDAAKEELLAYKKQYGWDCAVCHYPMKRIAENQFVCRYCLVVAENNVLRDRLGMKI